MKSYSGTDMIERQVAADLLRERYWGDPAYRLYQVNKSRQRTGSPLLESVNQIATKRGLAAQRERDDAGRFA